MIGSVIGNYKITGIIGEGGMGVVYEALDLKLDRVAAIKMLHGQNVNNAEFAERFKREARNQAKLNHPNIIQVYGLVEADDHIGIAMEYVEGETLEEILERQGKLDIGEALYVLEHILDGVGYAHEKGFIHRDIKPSNIIINEEGAVKIMDFGISKSLSEKGITQTGTKIGTVLYMSPEQIQAKEITPQSDIYSLGITFFEMIAGITPFEYENEFEIMEGHIKKPVPGISSFDKSIPVQIDKLIAKACAKDPMARYASCSDFKADIENLLERFAPDKGDKIGKPGFLPDSILRMKMGIVITVLAAALIAVVYLLYQTVSDFFPGIGEVDVKMTPGDTTYSFTENPRYNQADDWLAVPTGVPVPVNDMAAVDDTTMLLCGDYIILKTTNSGESWYLTELPDSVKLNDVEMNRYGTVLAAGEKGALFFSQDTGETWSRLGTPAAGTIFDIEFGPGDAAVTLGAGGEIMYSSDAGSTWSITQSGTDELLFDGEFTGDGKVLTVGMSGLLLVSSDNGRTWQQKNKFETAYLKDAAVNPDGEIFLCGAGGIIYYSDDGGDSWDDTETGVMSGLNSIAFTTADQGIVSSSNGEILFTADGGDTWQRNINSRLPAVNRIIKLQNGQIYALSSDGFIYKYKKKKSKN